jgi:hypothetical protein
LIGGTKPLDTQAHGGLRGSGHRSVISYIHGESCCIAMCVVKSSPITVLGFLWLGVANDVFNGVGTPDLVVLATW